MPRENVTLEASLSISWIMEFLKSVPAVAGRLVISLMLCAPSGHIPETTALELQSNCTFVTRPRRFAVHRNKPTCDVTMTCGSPLEEEPLEVLEEVVLVLLHESLHRVGDVAGVVHDAEVAVVDQVLVFGRQLKGGTTQNCGLLLV